MMKRGLSSLDIDRTPPERYRARVEQLRRGARERDLDAVLVYGDVSSGGDIAYLTHTTLYWGHAILVVPSNDRTTLVMSLSPRTRDWFDSTGVLDDQASGPRLDQLVRGLTTTRGYAKIGVVDQDSFPAELLAGVGADLGVQFVDLGPEVRRLRATPDSAAISDLAECAQLASHGLTAAETSAVFGDPDLVRADAEFAMRSRGAWDATAIATRTARQTVTVQLRCQLRDAWYGAERSFTSTVDSVVEGTRAVYETLAAALRAGVNESGLAELADAQARELGVNVPILEVRLESAPDVEWRPVFPTASLGLADGAVTHLVLQAWGGDGSLLAAFGDTYLVGADASIPVAHARRVT